MATERRSIERVRGPVDASWSGTSGHRTVRITDISELPVHPYFFAGVMTMLRYSTGP